MAAAILCAVIWSRLSLSSFAPPATPAPLELLQPSQIETVGNTSSSLAVTEDTPSLNLADQANKLSQPFNTGETFTRISRDETDIILLPHSQGKQVREHAWQLNQGGMHLISSQSHDVSTPLAQATFSHGGVITEHSFNEQAYWIYEALGPSRITIDSQTTGKPKPAIELSKGDILQLSHHGDSHLTSVGKVLDGLQLEMFTGDKTFIIHQ